MLQKEGNELCWVLVVLERVLREERSDVGKDREILQSILLKCLSCSELCDFWVKVVAGPQLEGRSRGPLSVSIPLNDSSSHNGGKITSPTLFWRMGLLQHPSEAYKGLFEHLQYTGLEEGKDSLRQDCCLLPEMVPLMTAPR